MRMTDRIQDRLASLQPQWLDLVDESEKHHGHAGWREGGETHFRVTLVAAAFEGLTKVQRQRAVYAALSKEFEDGLHALSITALTPAEHEERASQGQ